MKKKPMKIAAKFAAVILSCALASIATANSFTQGNVTVTHPWSRPTPPGVPVGVGYMAISNQGDTDITFVGATTPKAKRVTIHQSSMKDGLMSMRLLPDGLRIPAGETVLLEPGSYHLMLEELDGAIARDGTFPMTLEFDAVAPVQIELHTMPMASSGTPEKHSSGDH